MNCEHIDVFLLLLEVVDKSPKKHRKPKNYYKYWNNMVPNEAPTCRLNKKYCWIYYNNMDKCEMEF